MTRARRKMAEQMESDGIRSLTKAEKRTKPLCSKVEAIERNIVCRCHNRARYDTPVGRRCFKHAIELRS